MADLLRDEIPPGTLHLLILKSLPAAQTMATASPNLSKAHRAMFCMWKKDRSTRLCSACC